MADSSWIGRCLDLGVISMNEALRLYRQERGRDARRARMARKKRRGWA